MTTHVVDDETLGVLGRKYNDLFRRVREGSLPPKPVLKGMQDLVEGRFQQPLLINFDYDPVVPKGWTVESHKKCGVIDPSKIALHRAPAQKVGLVKGTDLEERLEGLPVANANVLDFLFANSHLIPEELKEQCTCFWGTKYRSSGGRRGVRYLSWHDGQWRWDYAWIVGVFGDQTPAALYVPEPLALAA